MKKKIILSLVSLSLLFTTTASYASVEGVSATNNTSMKLNVYKPMYIPCGVYTDGHHFSKYSYPNGSTSYQHDHYILGVKFNCTITKYITENVSVCPCGYEQHSSSYGPALHSAGY